MLGSGRTAPAEGYWSCVYARASRGAGGWGGGREGETEIVER